MSTTLTKQYYGKSEKTLILEFSISLDKKPTNILIKVLAPLSLLVLAMWAVFWINIEALSERLILPSSAYFLLLHINSLLKEKCQILTT